VDLADHSARYPFSFMQGDALEYALAHGADYDLIHASPPCQLYSALNAMHSSAERVDLVAPTRQLLLLLGVPWIMENVPGAPLRGAVVLCGSMFELGARCADGKWRQLRRHRLFESSHPLEAPRPCRHQGEPVGVYGKGAIGFTGRRRGYQAMKREALAAMGTPWMSRAGVSQAIPPAYTQHLAGCLVNPPLTLW
jgi:DNA (cytosine-5)-methyltransferase 1